MIKKYNGFSLLEVLISIAIVALIAVVSLPLFSMSMSNIRKAEIDSTDLFELESEIEESQIAPYDEGILIFNYADEPVTIEVDVFEAADDDKNVSITYFNYRDIRK